MSEPSPDPAGERSLAGKIAHGCFIVFVMLIVAVFLVFGVCMVMLS